MEQPEQTLTLSETTGFLRKLAGGWLQYHDAYFVVVDGVRVKVVAGAESPREE